MWSAGAHLHLLCAGVRRPLTAAVLRRQVNGSAAGAFPAHHPLIPSRAGKVAVFRVLDVTRPGIEALKVRSVYVRSISQIQKLCRRIQLFVAVTGSSYLHPSTRNRSQIDRHVRNQPLQQN